MTYRSAEDALRARTDLLSDELRTLEQRQAETARLDREAAELRESLAKSRALLERFEQRRASPHLPLLDQVRVASPCNARWEDMTGDDKTRFCGKCEKNVYNLSAMTRDEAELLVLEREGQLCARFYRRADGTMITQDCPVGVRRKRLRLVGVLAIGGGMAAMATGFAASLLVSRGGHPEAVQGKMEMPVQMGDIGPASPPPAPPAPPVPSGERK
ncbi:MAG: hypothetical protein IPF92_30525 [Myxococcales bacterium]|nr:hypothetical protein [Myxococcales bacterium]MBL0196940.1 hypothetical protein [Myxococcales bacterium]HQY63795.1 hypothetical protein [Polyangiaceae bacterium]